MLPKKKIKIKEKKVNKEEFKFHPEIEDKDFYKKLYAKKEFHKYYYDDEKRKMEDICPATSKSSEFKLMPHQEFLRNYISPHTPYNGVLIYHSTGVGKTCTAISIAEGFKNVLQNYGKKILVISSEAIRKNFKKEIYNPNKEKLKKKMDDNVQCTGLTYELGEEFKYLTKEQRYIKIEKIINEHYQFFPYQAFANYVKKNIGWDGDLSKLNEAQKLKINQIYSKRVIIIDEVHNIRKGTTKGDKDSFKILEGIIRYANNLKLVFMSATPMYDQPKEIIDLLNLLLLNDNREQLKVNEIFDSDGNFKPDGKEKLLEISKGYISYLRGESPYTFPLRLYPKEAITPNVIYDIKGDEIDEDDRLKFSKLILCPMQNLQLETYNYYINERLEKIKNKSGGNNKKKSIRI